MRPQAIEQMARSELCREMLHVAGICDRGGITTPDARRRVASLLRFIANSVLAGPAPHFDREELTGGYVRFHSPQLRGFSVLCAPHEDPAPLIREGLSAYLPAVWARVDSTPTNTPANPQKP